MSELEEITQKRDRARKRHDDLRKTRLNEFMEGFGIITAKLKEMYQVCCCWQSIFFVFARFCSGMLKLSNYAYIRVEQWAENIYTDSTTFYSWWFFSVKCYHKLVMHWFYLAAKFFANRKKKLTIKVLHEIFLSETVVSGQNYKGPKKLFIKINQSP